MDFANPIDELEWIYGLWKGTLLSGEDEFESYLTCRRIGSDIIELSQVKIFENKEELISRNFLFFDKTKEQIKLVSFNSEGYIETSNMILNVRNKYAHLKGKFESGYNLPPNMNIIKEVNYTQNPKQIEFVIKMGLNEEIVTHGTHKFSKKLR